MCPFQSARCPAESEIVKEGRRCCRYRAAISAAARSAQKLPQRELVVDVEFPVGGGAAAVLASRIPGDVRLVVAEAALPMLRLRDRC